MFNSKSMKNGRYIYFVKKNGDIYNRPAFIAFCGTEKSEDDIIARLKRLNPGKEYVAADVFDDDTDARSMYARH